MSERRRRAISPPSSSPPPKRRSQSNPDGSTQLQPTADTEAGNSSAQLQQAGAGLQENPRPPRRPPARPPRQPRPPQRHPMPQPLPPLPPPGIDWTALYSLYPQAADDSALVPHPPPLPSWASPQFYAGNSSLQASIGPSSTPPMSLPPYWDLHTGASSSSQQQLFIRPSPSPPQRVISLRDFIGPPGNMIFSPASPSSSNDPWAWVMASQPSAADVASSSSRQQGRGALGYQMAGRQDIPAAAVIPQANPGPGNMIFSPASPSTSNDPWAWVMASQPSAADVASSSSRQQELGALGNQMAGRQDIPAAAGIPQANPSPELELSLRLPSPPAAAPPLEPQHLGGRDSGDTPHAGFNAASSSGPHADAGAADDSDDDDTPLHEEKLR